MSGANASNPNTPNVPTTPVDAAANVDEREQRRREREQRRAELEAALQERRSNSGNSSSGNNSSAQSSGNASGNNSGNASNKSASKVGASGATDKISVATDKAGNWLSNQPTPGGIAALIIGLGLLALLVFPVTTADGKRVTRAQLLLMTIGGNARLVQNSGSKGSGNSGTGRGGGNSAQAQRVPVIANDMATPSHPSTATVGNVPQDMYVDSVSVLPNAGDVIGSEVGWMPLIP